jgi:hypothetical protein
LRSHTPLRASSYKRHGGEPAARPPAQPYKPRRQGDTNLLKALTPVRRGAGVLRLLALTLTLLSPAAAYAALPEAQERPPVWFEQGSDYAKAQRLGLAQELRFNADATAYTIALRGLSGGTIIIDDLVLVRTSDQVASYTLEIARPIGGGLHPVQFTARLWVSPSPPAPDGTGACAQLDLLAAAGTLARGRCGADARMQIILTLPHDAAGQATVSLRPARIATGP